MRRLFRPSVHARLRQIEAVVTCEVGRNIGALAKAAKGGLVDAALSLARTRRPHVGIITGMYIPIARPRGAPETDGIVGAAQLARAFLDAGWRVRVATDGLCENAVVAALAAAGAYVPVDSAPIATLLQTWPALDPPLTHVIAIEHLGRARDGGAYNMWGHDLRVITPRFDEVFLAVPARRIAIGDGGNEIGMGSLPQGLIARHVRFGARIACVTPADHLIVAGVSNWGAWGLLAALAAMRPGLRATVRAALSEACASRIMSMLFRKRLAVDGVTRRRAMSVDGLPWRAHLGVLKALRALA